MTQIEIEMFADYKEIDGCMTLAEKKAYAEKYGVDSKKAADIQEGILVALAKIRATKTEFEADDLRNWRWMKKSSSLERVVGMAKAFEGENEAFVEFVKKHYETKAAAIKYPRTMAEKSIFNVLKTFTKWENEVKNSTDTNRLELIALITNELKEFHDEYIEMNRAFFNREYERAIESKARYEVAKKKYNEAIKDLHWNSPEYRALYKEFDRTWSRAKFHSILCYKKEEYVEREIANVERIYKNDIIAIAERVRAKSMDERNITISNPSTDPKFIEMDICDGTRHLYARSIIAAEYSCYMRPHYRFIITEQH